MSAERERGLLDDDPPDPDDVESARCTCEWVQPRGGEICADWPAVLDPQCLVHGAPNRFPEPPEGERIAVSLSHEALSRLRSGSYATMETEDHADRTRGTLIVHAPPAPSSPEENP